MMPSTYADYARFLLNSTYGKAARMGAREKTSAVIFRGRHRFERIYHRGLYRCAYCGTFRTTLLSIERGRGHLHPRFSMVMAARPELDSPLWLDEREVPHECRQIVESVTFLPESCQKS